MLSSVAGEDVRTVGLGHAVEVGAEQLRCAQMAFGRRRVRELEGRRRGGDHRGAVRHHGVVDFVSRRSVVPDETGYGIGAGMGNVGSGVAEPHSREARRPAHPGTRLQIGRVEDGPPEVAAHQHQRLLRPHVADRVGADVQRPVPGRGVGGRRS